MLSDCSRMTTSCDPRVSCIVKLGGAALTNKGQLEVLNTDVLMTSARQLSEAFGEDKRLIVVHGAGGFGHQLAKHGGVANGPLANEAVKKAFIFTRLSVTKLNHMVTAHLAHAGVNAVALPPFGVWNTSQRQVSSDGCDAVRAALQQGLTPVLHGDCVLDEELGCTVLGGDQIVERLARKFEPRLVVFLTNVDGVFSAPPEEPDAVLLPVIRVKPDMTWYAEGFSQINMRAAATDVTGGIAAKVQEATLIASLGIPVVICKAGTPHALAAVQNGACALLDRHWRGTIVACETYEILRLPR